jgi:hypothetical protein
MIVIQRVPYQEHPFHMMCRDIFLKLSFKPLSKQVLKDSIELLQEVLKAEKSMNQNESKHVKNIATWLGIITLGSNKIIPIKYMDLKKMLEMDHYKKINNKQIVLNSVINILEQSNNIFISKFNPWFSSIILQLEKIKA